MTSRDDLIDRLGAPFSYNDIDWRLQQTNEENTRGRAVPYLRFQAIADRLDSVVGANNWKNEYFPGPAGGVVCRLSIRVDGDEWIAKENGAENTSFEPVKGGLTDAFKRSAVMWNIGRYLYNFPGWTVDVDPDTRYIVSTPLLPASMLIESERKEFSMEAHTERASANSGAAEPTTPAVADVSADSSSNREAPQLETKADPVKPSPEPNPEPNAEANAATLTSNDAGTAPAGPSEKDGLTLEDAMDSVPEGLDEEHVKRIRTILTRSWDNADLRPNMRTYVNDRTKSKMPEQAIFYVLEILERLDELDAVSAAS